MHKFATVYQAAMSKVAEAIAANEPQRSNAASWGRAVGNAAGIGVNALRGGARAVGRKINDFTNSVTDAYRERTMPSGPQLSDQDIERIFKEVSKIPTFQPPMIRKPQ